MSTKKRYIIGSNALGGFPELEIDYDRFDKLKKARDVLRHALAIEEKYELIITNYLDLEKEATNFAITGLVRKHTGTPNFSEIKNAITVRILNLLTAARLYVDSLTNHILSCISNTCIKSTDIRQLFVDEFESNFNYCFMEALRNYAQHCATPVHQICKQYKIQNDGENAKEFAVDFYAKKSTLSLDNSFKRETLKEMPTRVNLREAARSYVESLSRIQQKTRELICESVNFSRETFEDARNQYIEFSNDMPRNLYAFELENMIAIRKVLIDLEWDDIRLALLERNPELEKLTKMHITSKPSID